MASSTEPDGRPTRREQILAAAAELFARRGFHGVSIDDIGAAVGISGPALYRHFRSKDAMLAEMLTSISEVLLSGAQRTLERDANRPAERVLGDLVRFQVDFALDNPALITVQERSLGILAEPDRRRVRAMQRRYVELWVRTIMTLVPDVSEPGARAAAHAVFGLINSTPHSVLPQQSRPDAYLDRAQMAELLYRMSMAALASPGSLATREPESLEQS